MKHWPFVAAVAGIGILGLTLRQRQRSAGLGQTTAIERFVAHPAVFGVAAGVANGVLATARNKPVSFAANVITALVIGISEGMLTENTETAFRTAGLSIMGASAGMAPFTRFSASERALIERKTVPAPA